MKPETLVSMRRTALDAEPFVGHGFVAPPAAHVLASDLLELLDERDALSVVADLLRSSHERAHRCCDGHLWSARLEYAPELRGHLLGVCPAIQALEAIEGDSK